MNDYEKYVDHFQPDSLLPARSNFEARNKGIDEYAWAIPNDRAIEVCIKYGPLIEIGAGNGYWASLIKDEGGIIYAYDIEKENAFVCLGVEDRVAEHLDCNLFLCWPPYNQPMAWNCLTRFKGQYVIYVGEGNGGCTGCDPFHEMLNRKFVEIELVRIPQWYGLHDYLTVWERR